MKVMKRTILKYYFNKFPAYSEKKFFLISFKNGDCFRSFYHFYERYMEQQERLQVEVGVQVEVAVLRPVPRRVVRMEY